MKYWYIKGDPGNPYGVVQKANELSDNGGMSDEFMIEMASKPNVIFFSDNYGEFSILDTLVYPGGEIGELIKTSTMYREEYPTQISEVSGNWIIGEMTNKELTKDQYKFLSLNGYINEKCYKNINGEEFISRYLSEIDGINIQIYPDKNGKFTVNAYTTNDVIVANSYGTLINAAFRVLIELKNGGY